MTTKKQQERLLCNQIAIMESLVVLMAHLSKPELGNMTHTWQFDFLKQSIEESKPT